MLVDFVHNPHGFRAVAQAARRMEPRRIGVMIGQAGDRDDASILGLARAAWSLAPEHVAIKEMAHYLRGRAEGEVPEMLRAELRRVGAADGQLSLHPDEVAAARHLLAWSRPGDLLVLSTQEDRAGVLALAREAERASWRPGEPLPEA